MQSFPHVFEIADGRGVLDDYDLQGERVTMHNLDAAQLKNIVDDG